MYLAIPQCLPPPDWKLPPTGPVALAGPILSWAHASFSHTDPDLFWHCSHTRPADVALPLRGAALSVLPSNPNTPATRASPYGRPTLPVSGPETASPGPERKKPSTSRGLSRASQCLSKRCIHYPSSTPGMLKSLVSE